MPTHVIARGIDYSDSAASFAAESWFSPHQIPDDFGMVLEDEMRNLLPEGISWFPYISEVWAEVGDEQAEAEWDAFDWSEAWSTAFDRATARFADLQTVAGLPGYGEATPKNVPPLEYQGRIYVYLEEAHMSDEIGQLEARAVCPTDWAEDGLAPVYRAVWSVSPDRDEQSCDWDDPDEVVKTGSVYDFAQRREI